MVLRLLPWDLLLLRFNALLRVAAIADRRLPVTIHHRVEVDREAEIRCLRISITALTSDPLRPIILATFLDLRILLEDFLRSIHPVPLDQSRLLPPQRPPNLVRLLH